MRRSEKLIQQITQKTANLASLRFTSQKKNTENKCDEL